jgi:hypothetical protein
VYNYTVKALFLDFDGVLNSHRYLYSNRRPAGMEFKGNEHLMLDPAAVARVNRIIEATGAKVVISSSWRHGWPLERIREILAARAFVGDIIGITPDAPQGVRGDEIAQWLDEHPGVTKFVAIDDDTDDSLIMKHHLVKTMFAYGLQDHHVEDAISRLL